MIGIISNRYWGYEIWRLRINGPYMLIFSVVLLIKLISQGQLNSITWHIFCSLSHTSRSGLLWITFVVVLIEMFHQYSWLSIFNTYSLTKSVSKEASKQASKQASKEGRKEGRKEGKKEGRKEVSKELYFLIKNNKIYNWIKFRGYNAKYI